MDRSKFMSLGLYSDPAQRDARTQINNNFGRRKKYIVRIKNTHRETR